MRRARSAGRLEAVRLVNGDQLLVFHLVVVPPPATATAMARITPLLDVDQGHFQGQSLVRKRPREMDQLVEQVEDRAPFRTLAAAAPPGRPCSPA